MSWRRWNQIFHRDIGYFCIGLTIIYAVSGVAVNHTSHGFNPSYTIATSEAEVAPLGKGKRPDTSYISAVLRELEIAEKVKTGAMLTPDTIRIFTTNHTIDVNINTGRTTLEKVTKKPFLFESNYLHLNKAKGLWTWIADLYGVALAVLAITGLLMIRGPNRHRGLFLAGAGLLLPLVYLLFSL